MQTDITRLIALLILKEDVVFPHLFFVYTVIALCGAYRGGIIIKV